jgi:predicted dehydrogenase
MGLAHSRRLAEDERSSIVAFFDPDQSAAERLRESFAPDATVHATLDELLASTDADAAVIATPTTSHCEQIHGVAERGWHVLSEKPLADTRKKIVDLINLAETCDNHFMLGYQRRFWTVYRRLREEIQSGRHGRITAMTSVNSERWQQTIKDTWRDDPLINSAGFLGDAGSHKIDVLFYVTGLQPTDVFAINDTCGSRVPVVSSVAARLEGGVPLTITFTGHANSFHEELFIHCEESDLVVRDQRLWIGRDNQLKQVDLPENETGPESVRNPVTGFLDLLSGAAENPAPFACALPVFDFTAAILDSAEAAQP